jgi:predicted amidohydrolase YtcJ
MKTLFTNASIYSPERLWADCLAVCDGRIFEIGSKAKLMSLRHRGFKVIDLKGKVILPGFVDAHLHLLATGYNLLGVDLSGIDSLDKTMSLINRATQKLAPGHWLVGRGWNKNLWAGGLPDRTILDKASPDNPALFHSKDGHMLWVNSTVLKLCGINRNTPDPSGGHIGRDSAGKPTGILFENACNLVISKIPEPSVDLKLKAIRKAIKKLNSLGITGISDCDGYANRLSLFKQAQEKDILSLRVFMMLAPDDINAASSLGLKTGFGDDFLNIGCLKLYMDGSLGSQTAWMFSHYLGETDNFGVSTMTNDELEMYFEKTHIQRISLAVHAIGDRANSELLNFFGRKYAVSKKLGLKHRIEHAQVLRKSDIPKFKKYNVGVSVQPVHIIADRDLADKHWGKRSKYAYPYNMLLKAGAQMGFGSDSPIEDPNPFMGIYSAVARKRPGEDKQTWYPEQKLTVKQAVKSYTIGSADICGWQGKSGILAEGARADFVVISDDIFKIKQDEIPDIKVLATIVDGRVVYNDRSFVL